MSCSHQAEACSEWVLCSPLLVRICTCMMHWRAQLFEFECKKTISSFNKFNSEMFPFHSLMFVFCIENIINGITSRKTVKPTMSSNPSPPVERGKTFWGHQVSVSYHSDRKAAWCFSWSLGGGSLCQRTWPCLQAPPQSCKSEVMISCALFFLNVY